MGTRLSLTVPKEEQDLQNHSTDVIQGWCFASSQSRIVLSPTPTYRSSPSVARMSMVMSAKSPCSLRGGYMVTCSLSHSGGHNTHNWPNSLLTRKSHFSSKFYLK